MGFFSILSDISRNKSNFEQWEQQERDNDAKRKALYEKGVGKERFKDAKKRGDVIIDVITQMDQHSENVAEDVETALQQAQGAVAMPIYLAAYAVGTGLLFKGGSVLSKTTEEFIKKHNLAEIKQEITQNASKEGNRSIISYVNNSSLLKSKNLAKYKKYLSAESYEKLAGYTKDWAKSAKPYKKYFIGAAAAYLGIFLGGMTIMQYFATKMQIGSSRIARWQSRESLKDPKNFVVYTPEQIEEAKKKLKDTPAEQKSLTSKISEIFLGGKKLHKKGMLKNIKDVLKDREAYEKWKANDTKEIVDGQLSEEEIQKAKLDKELIQRITKKINNKAEEYSENMETAAETIIGSSLFGGAALGGALGWILEKTGIGEKIAYKKLKKEAGSDIVEKVKQITKENISKIEKDAKLNKIKKEIAQKIANKEVPEGLLGFLYNMGNFIKGNRISKLVTKSGRISNTAKSLGFITTIIGGLFALKLQKSASRAGRYIAREEFKDNPQEFMSYTDEEMALVSDVKGGQRTLGQRFKEWITFVPTAIKQMRKYDKYKKTELVQKEKLQKELIKLDVTDKQIQDAKNLQRKLYNTFEVVDEKSQSYSEYMEFANEASQPFIVYGAMGVTLLPLIAAGIGVATGKISLAKLGDWITAILAKFSKITKSNLFKKHITEMGQKANSIIDSVEQKPMKEIAKKYVKNIRKNYEKMTNAQKADCDKKLKLILGDSYSSLDKLDESKAVELVEKLFIDVKENLPKKQQLSEILSLFKEMGFENISGNLNVKEQLTKMLKDESSIAAFNKFLEEHSIHLGVVDINGGKVDKALIEKLIKRFEIIEKNFPKEETQKAFKDFLSHALENPEKFATLMQENPQALAEAFKTPTFKKVAMTLGIGYGGLITLLTYLLLSKFASMQKDAGRLGVMKAIEDLQDYRYYADETFENSSNKLVKTETGKPKSENVFSAFNLPQKKSM